MFLFTADQDDRDLAALAVPFGLDGLRVSEACATKRRRPRVERGYRTLRILGKGNKPAITSSFRARRAPSTSPSANGQWTDPAMARWPAP